MKLHKIKNYLLRESAPLAVLPETLKSFINSNWNYTEKNTQPVGYEVTEKTAIIPIKGALTYEPAPCGESISQIEIQNALMSAYMDDAVENILLDINSPGGEVAGTKETADLIHEINQYKKVVAYVGDMAASAGYWLASQASEIIMSETASVGSIGVRAVVTDYSKYNEKEGIKEYSFLSSQSPKKDFDVNDNESISELQKQLDYLAEIFIGAVARGRKTFRDHVSQNYGRGGIVYGREAVFLGMSDKIGTFQEALNSLRPKIQNQNTGGFQSMEHETETDLRKSILEAERNRVIGIQGIAAHSDEEREIVKNAIISGLTIEQTALKILQARENGNVKKLEAIQKDAQEIPAIVSEPTKEENKDDKELQKMASLINSVNEKGGLK